jgi:hypothetical protein
MRSIAQCIANSTGTRPSRILVCDIQKLSDHGAAIGSTKPGSLFFTLPTRALTGQQTIPSAARTS